MAAAIFYGSRTPAPTATSLVCRVVFVVAVTLCASPSCAEDALELAVSSLATTPPELIAERVSAGLDQSNCRDRCDVNGTQPNMCTCRANAQECRDRGDCCADRFFEEVSRPRLACVPAFNRDLVAVVRCPLTWLPANDADETKVRCEDEKRENMQLSYLDDLPVLSRSSGVLYRNVYCASCNSDTRNLRPWELLFQQCSPKNAFETKLARRASAGPGNYQGRLTLYAKLAGVFGLTWVFGFAAALTGLRALWYPFIVLCGLQGAFIFLAFTFKRSVFRMVRERLCGCSSGRRLRPRSTSTTLTTALHSALCSSSYALASVATGRAMGAQSTACPKGVQKPLLRRT